MEEQGPKSLIFLKRGDAVFEVAVIGIGESLARVGEVTDKAWR